MEGFDYLKWNLGSRYHLHVRGERGARRTGRGWNRGLLPAAALPSTSWATDLGIGPVFFFCFVFFSSYWTSCLSWSKNAITRRRCQNRTHRGEQTNTTEVISVVQTHKQRRGVEPSEGRGGATLLKAFQIVRNGRDGRGNTAYSGFRMWKMWRVASWRIIRNQEKSQLQRSEWKNHWDRGRRYGRRCPHPLSNERVTPPPHVLQAKLFVHCISICYNLLFKDLT